MRGRHDPVAERRGASGERAAAGDRWSASSLSCPARAPWSEASLRRAGPGGCIKTGARLSASVTRPGPRRCRAPSRPSGRRSIARQAATHNGPSRRAWASRLRNCACGLRETGFTLAPWSARDRRGRHHGREQRSRRETGRRPGSQKDQPARVRPLRRPDGHGRPGRLCDGGQDHRREPSRPRRAPRSALPKGGIWRIGTRIKDIKNPHAYSWGGYDSNVSRQVVEYLTFTDVDDVTRPYLAESWEVSPDLKTWTFKIRKGVKWTKGDELTADHVIWNLKHALDPAVGSSMIGLVKAYLLNETDGRRRQDDDRALGAQRHREGRRPYVPAELQGAAGGGSRAPVPLSDGHPAPRRQGRVRRRRPGHRPVRTDRIRTRQAGGPQAADGLLGRGRGHRQHGADRHRRRCLGPDRGARLEADRRPGASPIRRSTTR